MSDYAQTPEPGKLLPMNMDEVKARARRIFKHRGMPPYTQETFCKSTPIATAAGTAIKVDCLTDDELALINEFMAYWLPLITGEHSEGSK